MDLDVKKNLGLFIIGIIVFEYYSPNCRAIKRSKHAKHAFPGLLARRQLNKGTLVLGKRFKSLEEGPPRNSSYDPTYGYEPYWKDGEWVMDPDVDLNGSSTLGPNCPYVTCPEPFVKFGPVCGRNKFHSDSTFKNYCAMLHADCDGRDDWLLVYRGPCHKALQPLKWTLNDMRWRARSLIVYWWSHSPSTVFERPGGTTYVITTPTPPPQLINSDRK